MAVLLQYNEVDSLTVQQLQENTGKRNATAQKFSIFINPNRLYSSDVGISIDSLIQVVQILLKTKLLKSTDNEGSITPASVIDLFLEYKK